MGEQLAGCACVQRYDSLHYWWVCKFCGRRITDEELHRRGLDVAQEVSG